MTTTQDEILAEGVLGETTINATNACQYLPGSRGTNRVHPATVIRWIQSGVKCPASKTRVKLEAVRVGSRWMTSVEAVKRFVNATTTACMNDAPAVRTPSERKRASAVAERQLIAMGC